jgi:phosphoglycolate phosphatase-like HAD superfamily hydrolase
MAADPGPHGNWRWRHGPVSPGRAVVFDLDGVLSDAASRQHFLEGPWRDWESFFDSCGDDPLIEEVAGLLGLLAHDLVIVLLTARPGWVAPQTLAWLHRYGLRWDLLVMRDHGSYQAAREFKRRSVRELREAGFDLVMSFEDDRRNVAMFREEHVPAIYIHSGYYD